MTSPMDEDQIMRQQMEQVVDTYDAYMHEATAGQEQALRETTVTLAQIQPGDRVLEVGCGTGTLTLAAKRRTGPSGTVVGIDVIPGMIEQSQQKAAQAQADVTFQEGSIAAIPFSDNHFDVVLCSFMIFHMSEATRQKGITEIYRVLKPQGRLLVLDSAPPPQPAANTSVSQHAASVPIHDVQELRPLLEAAGFSEIESAPVAFPIQGPTGLAFLRARVQKP